MTRKAGRDGMTGAADARAEALLAPGAVIEGAEGLAETCLRRLANRHGCTLRIDGCFLTGGCPDPVAHKQDVLAMTIVLQAAGLAHYRSMPRKKTSRNFR